MNTGKRIDEISLGDCHEQAFTVTQEMIETFAEATGDKNPIHLDEEFARDSVFKTRVAHGMLGAGFISAGIGTAFPGVGTIYLSQTLRFHKPVFIGDRITARITAVEKKEEKNRLRLETVLVNGNGDTVVSGEAVVMPPR